MQQKYTAHYIRANVDNKTEIRYEEFEGVKHLVVPVIAAKQMVMNGLFYPAEEFRDWVETWNGVPVPINHPQQNGLAISARSPRIQELTSVGSFFNVEFTEDNKLKGEIWLNTEKVKKLDAEYLIKKFENGEIMEVSTGLYSNLEMLSGVYDGEEYTGIVRHIRPDHLALLPNEVGACSLADGCGAMRANLYNNCGCGGKCTKSNGIKEKFNKAFEIVSEKLGFNQNKHSYQDLNRKVDEKLVEIYETNLVYILDMYDDKVIYSIGNGPKLYQRGYGIDGDKVYLEDSTQEVTRKTEYKPIIDIKQNSGGNIMDKAQLIQSVIANSTNSFTEEDKSELESLNKTILSKMAINEEPPAQSSTTESEESASTESENTSNDSEAKEQVKDETEKEEVKEEVKEEEVKKEVAEEKVEEAQEETTEQKVNKLVNSVQDAKVKKMLEIALNESAEKHKILVKGIIENSKFTKEDLSEMTLSQIEKLHDSLIKPNFNGRGTVLAQAEQKYKIPSIFD